MFLVDFKTFPTDYILRARPTQHYAVLGKTKQKQTDRGLFQFHLNSMSGLRMMRKCQIASLTPAKFVILMKEHTRMSTYYGGSVCAQSVVCSPPAPLQVVITF